MSVCVWKKTFPACAGHTCSALILGWSHPIGGRHTCSRVKALSEGAQPPSERAWVGRGSGGGLGSPRDTARRRRSSQHAGKCSLVKNGPPAFAGDFFVKTKSDVLIKRCTTSYSECPDNNPKDTTLVLPHKYAGMHFHHIFMIQG